jgi:hypothetical protein
MICICSLVSSSSMSSGVNRECSGLVTWSRDDSALSIISMSSASSLSATITEDCRCESGLCGLRASKGSLKEEIESKEFSSRSIASFLSALSRLMAPYCEMSGKMPF